MKYLSFFSGIGGFEMGLHREIPNATCVGYSEIDKYALKVYKHHFPTHRNLGDITKISTRMFMSLLRREGCDLIIGGFPCTNLSSMSRFNGNSNGLSGPHSKLIYPLSRLIKIAANMNPALNIVIENNASMRNEDVIKITKILESSVGKQLYVTELNSQDFGLQKRRRLFWTTFPIKQPKGSSSQTWKDVLKPVSTVKHLALSKRMVTNTINGTITNRLSSTGMSSFAIPHGKGWKIIEKPSRFVTRLSGPYVQDTKRAYAVPITTGNASVTLIDRRPRGYVLIRGMHTNEVERLFSFPDGYMGGMKRTPASKLLGNSVHIGVVRHVFRHLKRHAKTS